MPMMMRGIPAPRAKQFYIMSDSGRESRFYGDKFGPFCDPFGEPVKRAFAAYHYAVPNGKGMEFVTEYLDAAFAEGLDISVDDGLAEVCRRAGFDMNDVDFDSEWMAILENNLDAMAEGSLGASSAFESQVAAKNRLRVGGKIVFGGWPLKSKKEAREISNGALQNCAARACRDRLDGDCPNPCTSVSRAAVAGWN